MTPRTEDEWAQAVAVLGAKVTLGELAQALDCPAGLIAMHLPDDDCRISHAAWIRGVRTADVAAVEREWQRRNKARQRAAARARNATAATVTA